MVPASPHPGVTFAAMVPVTVMPGIAAAAPNPVAVYPNIIGSRGYALGIYYVRGLIGYILRFTACGA